MKLDVYWDEAGDPRARAAEGGQGELLARFLESDVQGSAAAAREILAAVERAEAGGLEAWEQTGNAYTLLLTPRGASLESEWEEGTGSVSEAEEIPLAELRDALGAWIDLLERGRSAGADG